MNNRIILPLLACIPAVALVFFLAFLPESVHAFFYGKSDRKLVVSRRKGNCVRCGRRTGHAYTYFSAKIEGVSEAFYVKTTSYSDIQQHYKHLCPSCLFRENLQKIIVLLIPAVILGVLASLSIKEYLNIPEYLLNPQMSHRFSTSGWFPILVFVLTIIASCVCLTFLLRLAIIILRLKGDYNEAASKIIESLPKENGRNYLTPSDYVNLKR